MPAIKKLQNTHLARLGVHVSLHVVVVVIIVDVVVVFVLVRGGEVEVDVGTVAQDALNERHLIYIEYFPTEDMPILSIIGINKIAKLQ